MRPAFQRRVNAWMIDCFGEPSTMNRTNRNHRFLEEAIELVQANGCSREEVERITKYVYDRDVGEVPQEIAGTMLTLIALANERGIHVDRVTAEELDRVRKPDMVRRIRAKDVMKPDFAQPDKSQHFLDLVETAINGGVSLLIAFAVPLAADLLFDLHLGAKSSGIAIAYFILTMSKTYVLRRWFRKLEKKHG